MPSVIGSGYSVVAPSPPANVLSLLDAPNGGFMNHMMQYRAQSYNGYTYVGFEDNAGRVKVSAINESTGAVVNTVTLHTFSVDNHDTPALLIRPSDHKLLVIYCGHNAANIYRRLSTTSLTTDPDLGDGFAAETDLSTSLGSWKTYTYPELVQLTDEVNDPIYLFFRERHSVDRLAVSKSTDGGATWGARTLIARADTVGTSKTYWNIGTNGTDRFDVFFSDYSDGADAEMYHFYYTGGNFKKSDGTTIDAYPLADADAILKSQMTLVLSNASGAVDRSMGLAWDGTAPAGLLWQRNGGSDNRLVSARWRTGAWQTDTVASSVGGAVSSNVYISGAAQNPADPDDVVVAKLTSGAWEMFSYTSADDGGTWTPAALTSGSGADNIHPTWVKDGAAITSVWSYGTYTDDTTFSLGLRGYAP